MKKCKALRMFVKGSIVSISGDRYECILSDTKAAAFCRLKRLESGKWELQRGLYNTSVIISNDVLMYLNNKSVAIIFDPRKK